MIVFFYCLNCLLSLYIFLFIYFSSYLSLPRSLFSKLLIAAYMFISHSLFLFLSLLLTHSFLDILYCLFLCHSILPYLHTLPSVFFTVYSTVCLFHCLSHSITLSFTHCFFRLLYCLLHCMSISLSLSLNHSIFHSLLPPYSFSKIGRAHV